MLHQNQQALLAQRKGVILLVVISLLTLFAIIGISFVLYANAAATSSKIFRDAASQNQPDMDPEMLLNFFFGQLLYDQDDVNGIYSAMRGHSLGRSIYGEPYLTLQGAITQGSQNVTLTATTGLSPGQGVFGLGIPAGTVVVAIVSPAQITISQAAQGSATVNLGFYLPATTAFNGTGRLHTSGPPTTTPPTYMNPFTLDDFFLPNYTYYVGDGFFRNPERINPIPPPVGPPWLASPSQAPGPYTGGANAPYTYPDLNNMFLAAVKADGTVLMPSFHRHWLFNPNNLLNDQSNPNWTNPQGKYALLRPRPNENPGFPYPEDPGGDVKNLPGPGYLYIDTSTGVPTPTYANNDSIWLDLNAPVIVAPDGTKFKALFAPLIIDLDGRVNLNVAGNVRGLEGTRPISFPANIAPGLAHRSNQGWGPWEINLETIFSPSSSNGIAEWPSLFVGNGTTSGRYGGDQVVSFAGNADTAGTSPHIYAQVDFDASNELNGYSATGPIQLPQAGWTTSFPSFQQGNPPFAWGQGGYGNGYIPPGGPSTGTERWQHPLLYNYFQPAGDDRVFPISNMEALLRYGDTNSPAMTSDIFRLCPGNSMFNPRSRNLVTTISFDRDIPGLAPWAIPPTPLGPGTSNYTVPLAPLMFPPAPRGPAANFPSLSARSLTGPSSGEFSSVDWRAINAALGRVNLNRYLTPYQVNVQTATTDRQQLAADIFVRLVSVTGAYDFNNPGAISGQPQFDALRWLAQLSANIVDYIDSDDVMTPFPWALTTVPSATGPVPNPAYQNYPQLLQAGNAITQFQTAVATLDTLGQGWVFGTELPRVVVNEAYAEYTVAVKPPPPGMPKGTYNFTLKIDVWAELHNPFNADQGDPLNGQANLAVYQLVLANAVAPVQPANSQNLRQGGNTIGYIPTTSQYSAPVQFPNPPNVIAPYNGGQVPNVGFFVVGPQTPANPNGAGATNIPGWSKVPAPAGSSVKSPSMSYQTTWTGAGVGTAPNITPAPPAPPTPTIALQRRANPLLPVNPLPGQPGNNPMQLPNPVVTVDYMEGADPSQLMYPTAPNPPVIWRVQDATNMNNKAYGRAEPYAGYAPMVQGETQALGTSFYQANQPLGAPAGQALHWLVHLDRELISPMELLQVSGYKPHELTQQFIFPTGGTLQPYQHRVSWFDEDLATAPPPTPTHALYRIFEFLETKNRAAGMTPGGRIPGKVNINTIWDPEILMALADPQFGNSNAFDSNAIYNPGPPPSGIWPTLLTLRSPQGVPGQSDNPFWSLAAGTYPAGDPQFQSINPTNNTPIPFGINNTLLRSNTFGGAGNTPRLFQGTVGGTAPSHPYLQDQLLTKIFNNLTTRSNTFAVFLTVGFFQVIQDTDPVTLQPVRPVKLGAELGKAENRHIRHRMFAIVDRTNLTMEKSNPSIIGPPPVYIPMNAVPVNYYTPTPPAPPLPPLPPGPPASGGWYVVSSYSGSYEGIPWGFAPGINLMVDTGPNQELVTVTGMTPNYSPLPGLPPINLVALTPFMFSHAFPVAITPVATLQVTSPPNPPAIPAGPQTIIISGNSLNGITTNTNVVVDIGANQETVTVVNATQASPGNPPTITAVFQKAHTMPFTISYPIPQPGNPGPQTNFDMRQVPWVVRHFSIIK